MTVRNFKMFYVQSYIIHSCICHESSLTVGIDLIFDQCSGVVDGTRYIFYLFIYLLNIFKQGRIFRQNHCFTMVPYS